MEKVRYMISDASSLIQVESHVLRYWEEELELEIPRNEMGHRYYTEENIRQFRQIKRLKEEGFQLKAIKMLIHNNQPDDQDETQAMKSFEKEEQAVSSERNEGRQKQDVKSEKWKEEATDAFKYEKQTEPAYRTQQQEIKSSLPYTGEISEKSAASQTAALSKLEQFQLMMNEIVRAAIAENNRALGHEVSTQVGEKVIKEMNYLMRDREEQEEERFRKLDESIRNHQRRPKKEKAAKQKTKKVRFRTRESIS